MALERKNAPTRISLQTLERVPTGLILFFFFLALYSFTMSGSIQYGDETEKYRVAQSIVERQDLSFRPTAQRNETGVGGRTYSIYELGQTVLEIPFYLVGKYLHPLTRLPDVNPVGQLLVGFLNPLLTALTAVLVYRTSLLLGFTNSISVGLSLVFGIATIAWPYSKGFTREPTLALFLMLSVYLVLRFQEKKQSAWLVAAGAAAGYLVFTKFIHAVVLPLLIIYLLLVVWQEHPGNWRQAVRPMLKTLLVFLLPTFVALGFQMLYAVARFGTLTSGIAGTRLDPLTWIVMLLQVMRPGDAIPGLLVSPEKSIFLYSPPALLFPLAWVKWFRVQKRQALLWMGLVLAELATVLFRPDWHGGTWWGPRYLVQITPLLILPLGFLFESQNSRRLWKRIVVLLAILGVGVQLVGAFANSRDYLDATGAGITLAGQIDFMLQGALDSIFIFLIPGSSIPQISPYGLLLISVAALCGFLLFARVNGTSSDYRSSQRTGFTFAAAAVVMLSIAFVAWVVAPFSNILAARGNSKFVAGELFQADGRTREASAMYLLALDLGTDYEQTAVSRLEAISQRPQGISIAAVDLIANAETTGEGSVTLDADTTLSGTSLRASIPPTQNANARGVTDPIPVSPDTMYELSGWVKAEAVYGIGAGALTVYEDDGDWKSRRATDVGILDETSGWRPFRKTLTTLPTTRRIFFAAGLWNTYGTLWVDKVELAKIAR